MIGIIVAAVVVALFALMLRKMGGQADGGATPASPPETLADDSPLPPDPIDEDEEDEGPEGMIAVTSDGLAFVPRDHGVLVAPAHRVRATHDDSADAPAFSSGDAEAPPQASVMLKPGDLIAARVRRGAPDLDPWRLETLGRDRDLTAWVFEVQEAAEAARDVLQRQVVQPPRDEHGDPIPVGDEDFWVAERELEQTFADLDRPDPPDGDDAPHGR
jgi:hypothetical protein